MCHAHTHAYTHTRIHTHTHTHTQRRTHKLIKTRHEERVLYRACARATNIKSFEKSGCVCASSEYIYLKKYFFMYAHILFVGKDECYSFFFFD